MKLKPLLLIILTVLTLTACTADVSDIDVEKAASDIVNTIEFEDKLELIPDEIAITLYGFDKEQIEEIATYAGSGATAEEVTAVKFKSITDEQKQLLKKRIESQIKSYETYIPEEIARIENNVIIYSGNTAVLCVSDNKEKAQEVIEELIY